MKAHYAENIKDEPEPACMALYAFVVSVVLET